MARAYDNDLRVKLLEAHAAGKGTLRELAEHFGVSVGWAWKVSAAHKKSGKMERPAQSRHGRASRVDESKVKALLQAQPDLVLRELQDELERTAGIRISHTQMWRVVRELDLRLKKSRSTPVSATQRKTSGDVPFTKSRSAPLR